MHVQQTFSIPTEKNRWNMKHVEMNERENTLWEFCILVHRRQPTFTSKQDWSYTYIIVNRRLHLRRQDRTLISLWLKMDGGQPAVILIIWERLFCFWHPGPQSCFFSIQIGATTAPLIILYGSSEFYWINPLGNDTVRKTPLLRSDDQSGAGIYASCSFLKWNFSVLVRPCPYNSPVCCY